MPPLFDIVSNINQQMLLLALVSSLWHASEQGDGIKGRGRDDPESMEKIFIVEIREKAGRGKPAG